MERIEQIIKEYSSKKLKQIVTEQASSYSSNFVDYAKDELIRRGEDFPLNIEWIKEISILDNDELKSIVENEYNKIHLEYIEIARNEYIKRGLKNETSGDEEQTDTYVKRFSGLRTISSFLYGIAWLFGIIMVIGIIIEYIMLSKTNMTTAIIISFTALLIGVFIFAILISQSEIIRVFIDIEENTRKYSDYYIEPETSKTDNNMQEGNN